jgi:hypothetical protein
MENVPLIGVDGKTQRTKDSPLSELLRNLKFPPVSREPDGAPRENNKRAAAFCSCREID